MPRPGDVPGVRTHASPRDAGATKLLLLSQVVLSLQLPFAVVPLVAFTGSRGLMGDFVAPRSLVATAWVIAAVIVGLNLYLFWGVVAG